MVEGDSATRPEGLLEANAARGLDNAGAPPAADALVWEEKAGKVPLRASHSQCPAVQQR